MRQVELHQAVGGVADFALAAHKDQDIARPFAAKLLHGIENRLQLIALGVVCFFHNRPVAHLNRIRTARDFDNRRIIKVARETLRIDGRRGNNDFQIRALWQQFAQVAQQKIDVQAALVRLIDNDGVVLHQQTVLLDLRQQDPVGHQLDHGVVADVIAKANFITDATARLGLQFFGDAVRDGTRREATRLGVADKPFYPAPQLHTDFRQLGRFPGAGLPRHDHHLVVAHGVENILFLLADRQVFRIRNGRARRFAQQDFPCRLAHLLRELFEKRLLRFSIFNLFSPVEATGEAAFIAQHQRVETCHQGGKGNILFFHHCVIRPVRGPLILKVSLSVEYHTAFWRALFKNLEHRIRYIALSL
ncbi:putative periplasmic protein kinase ArgK and related GTPases of G3E family [Cronobacter universalis NCTC 9529]|nr:putative periplasmic protein kinase ArgK and related GTPases of G3E family [Cronobacter universalis NCTC 9529]